VKTICRVQRKKRNTRTSEGVVVALSSNGWMNEDLTKDWLRRCWGTLNLGRRLLVWDPYKCHLTDGVRYVANKSTNSDMAIIPGGVTGHIQPADVCWNKPFKEAYKELYGEWTATGEKSYTQAGNICAPSKFQCLQWVKKAWESVSQDIVIKSFRCCGISVNVDGTEDKEIHSNKMVGLLLKHLWRFLSVQLLFWQPTRVTVRVMTLLKTLMRMKVN